MTSKQRGVSLSGALMWMIVLALGGLLAAKLMPSYLDFYGVKKIFAAMEQNGETKGTVREIRAAFDRRNQIENIKALNGEAAPSPTAATPPITTSGSSSSATASSTASWRSCSTSAFRAFRKATCPAFARAS
jgi:hypothetical protein